MKMIEGYTMCVLYKDTGTQQKEYFSKKSLALDWFESFRQVNKRPVTVIFYCGYVPYWVYYGNCKDKDNFTA